MSEPKRLYRSTTNKQVAGVCGGLGEYFNIDPTLIRVIFLIATLFGGNGFILYIILWMVMPEEGSERKSKAPSKTVEVGTDKRKNEDIV